MVATETIKLARLRDSKAAAAWEAVKGETNVRGLAASFAASRQHWDPAGRGGLGTWKTPAAPRVAPSTTPGLMLNLSGVWSRVHADDDRISTPQPWTRRAEAVRQAQADRAYLDQCRTETGDAAGPKHEKQKRERAELLAQTHTLARRLESAGVPAYRKDGAGLWVWWVCSKQAEQVPQFRRISFLPTVSAQVRSGKLAALEYFISRNPFCRFWTFTSGPRVRLENLRGRVVWLHERLNALNQFLRRNWSVELVFRSTELGSVEFDQDGNQTAENAAGRVEFDTDGTPLFHPHAHCVVQSLRGFIPPKQWAEMFAQIWAFWRDDAGAQLNWDGGRKGKSGVIRNARECCKYITKPGDMLKLSVRDLAETEKQLHGLKLVHPLGQLKREIAERTRAGKILVRVPTPDGTVWAERVDWNRFAEESDAERAGFANLKDARLMAKETAAAARAILPDAPRTIDQAAPWCRVFARLAPAVGPSGVKEPRVIVGGTSFQRRTVESHPLVFRLWAETVQSFDGGLAAERAAVFSAPWRGSGISVHTGTPTAKATPDGAAAADLDPAETWETASPLELFAEFSAP